MTRTISFISSVIRPLLPRLGCALLILAALLLNSCGGRYFTATVSGYIREANPDSSDTQGGVNGAEIHLYLSDPSSGGVNPIVRTSSMTSGGQDGYWSHKIIWNAVSPAFADEGDSGTVWVKVMRKGYFPSAVNVGGFSPTRTTSSPR